jgi:NAD(P)-dependent dehydrogenase (short-subunit alcohol dehydrogenase family)
MSRPQLVSRPSSVAAQNKAIILVSGGNTGIGYEIVKKLASDSPNNQVLLGCRDTHKGEEAVASMGAPVNVNPIQLDITDDKSIEHCFLAIQQHFGKLDVLINNAGTAAQHLPKDASLRDKFDLCMNVNVTSTAVITDRLVPLLKKSKLPKVIFISSTLGSLQSTLSHDGVMADVVWYSSSKSAMNALAAYYSKLYPQWKVNTVCPGYRATGLNGADLNEDTDPKLGAVRAAQLVAEGPDGVTGTYSRASGQIPW